MPHSPLAGSGAADYFFPARLWMQNLPPSLREQREVLAQCLKAMDQVIPLTYVYLFGSHARKEAHAQSDVDLCVVAEGAEKQREAVTRFGRAIWDIWPRPSFTIIPISPQRLSEKQTVGDHFFKTVLKEGILLATKN